MVKLTDMSLAGNRRSFLLVQLHHNDVAHENKYSSWPILAWQQLNSYLGEYLGKFLLEGSESINQGLAKRAILDIEDFIRLLAANELVGEHWSGSRWIAGVYANDTSV